MLLSMTGHGQALVTGDQVQVQVEVRTVNNRFLKININGDLDTEQIAKLESLIKNKIKRGSVSMRVKIQRLEREQAYKLNGKVLTEYASQLEDLVRNPDPVPLHHLLNLPGVIVEDMPTDDAAVVGPHITDAAERALEKLISMRSREGDAMAEDLKSNCKTIGDRVSDITKLAPRVADNYSQRITDRINGMLEQYNVTVTPADVIKEVGLFAERVDVSEELVRLGSHLEQFKEVLAADSSNGRKLDFLTQEILRETNTIGSKANDAEIASHVVEIKTVVERIREMVQNVE